MFYSFDRLTLMLPQRLKAHKNDILLNTQKLQTTSEFKMKLLVYLLVLIPLITRATLLEEFYGPYAHIRATLDYSYHSNYTFERQHFQDAILSHFLNAAVIHDKNGILCSTPTEPWLVFTAGAMGAGKSYTMNKLVNQGRFPLLHFVLVDPDEIRQHLPEYHLYLETDQPEMAGELTQKEAGYISEILTMAALLAGKNVLVDGSLRDADWYSKYIQRLRIDFPILRISILHVLAPRAAIFQQAAVSSHVP